MGMISVIMPAFNASEYIREAIDSILNQTENNFELLICDDGSIDATLSIIRSYSDPRIRLFVNGENKGNLFTTNLLFGECKGSYITIQDADDYAAPERLRTLLKEFEKDTMLGMVGSNYETVTANKEPISCGLLPLKNEEIKKEMEKEVIPMLYASVMIRKEIVQKAGYFPDFFHRIGYADLDFLSRCAELCKVANIRAVLYYYRKHTGSFNFYHNHNQNKNLVLEHMDMLIVLAHQRRIMGNTDYFAENDTKSMKRHISDFYVKKAENSFWEKKTDQAIKEIKRALIINLFNTKAYRTFFFILRKSLGNK